MSPQSVVQILRCFTLGGHNARVVDGRLETRGPQPLAGPLPGSIKANREELNEFLNQWACGLWLPPAGSGIRDLQEILDCSLATVLDTIEARRRRAA